MYETHKALLADERIGLVHLTTPNALVQHARSQVAAGELGRVVHVEGGFLQVWLLLDTDSNWRLETDKGGELRRVGDIGSHRRSTSPGCWWRRC